MTPAARTQAAIEILDQVIESARSGGAAADVLIARYFKTRRYAGSKDRRAVRDVVYDCIRSLGEMPISGRAAVLGARPDLEDHFGGEGHAPASLSADEPRAEPGLAPGWLLKRLGERADPALLERAPLDLRVNSLKARRDDLLHLGDPVGDLPNALTNAPDDIARRPEYLQGLVEIQDRGSQHIVQTCAPRAGATVIDLCAGAGGKSLGLAAEMANTGSILASDTDWRRLGELPARAERAGANIITPVRLNPGEERDAFDGTRADIVLIDAPCSGTGTWRRNPEAKWRLTPERLERLTGLQRHLISVGASLVKPGGALIYAVCSLLPEEGARQADRLPAEGFSEVSRVTLMPQIGGSDGFFIARFEMA
jgi:16S rRNA (cytosine967-C5)-methyltransferase|tara:strand:- start:45993 stop:47096 length:1104 start_codon:yes stop_codon:yes gene_type:complete